MQSNFNPFFSGIFINEMSGTSTAISKEQRLILDKVSGYQKDGLRVFASSSFQSHSIVMLHILSLLENPPPIYFLNTGFHFPETISFKNEIANRFNLDVRDVESPISKNLQRDESSNFYYVSKPDYCCYLNKVLPMESLSAKYDVWISGVRADQNKNRQSFSIEEKGNNDILRYHPMLNWDNKVVWKYIYDHDLPHHPLDALGYTSVGCEPCTSPAMSPDGQRINRWQGMNKSECGLHTDLIKR